MSDAADPISSVREAIEQSDFLRTARGVRGDGGCALALGAIVPRQLARREIEQLEALGNSCADWTRVRVADGFDPRSVRHSSFHGDVVLGRFREPATLGDGVQVPSGVYGSTVADSCVGHNALVRDVGLLARSVVGESARVVRCGSVACDRGTTFGNGQRLPIVMEPGGRDVAVYAELTVAVAAVLARRGARDAIVERYEQAVAEYAAAARCDRGIVERGALVRDTVKVLSVYAGPHAVIDGATAVSDSTILSDSSDPASILTGACVERSIVQWGGRVSTLAVVERAVLAEHCVVERHAKVSASILGPNTAVGGGEISASLVGPFVGFHHQALLIAAFWPEGKGNVSYGANVGSNHTSRAPDQEIWPGEGNFFGLGVNAQFPCDFSAAPYSVFATGITIPPQKIVFPFSLVHHPPARPASAPAGLNELIPAWVLRENAYLLRRNEIKYRQRNRARRTPLELDVFRPSTVDRMRDARSRLEAVTEARDCYSEREIAGLGKNFLTEANRRQAIDAYGFYTEAYALRGLERVLREAAGDPPRPAAVLRAILATPSADATWEHQRRILHDELRLSDPAAALARLPAMLERMARDVERSKAKDDERGARIIDDYAAVHAPAHEDELVRGTWQETRRLQAGIAELLARLGGTP